MGLINHYYYYRLREEMGAANFHAKLSLFAPRDPGYVEDISGAAILKSSKTPGGGAEVPRVPDQRRRTARARPQRQLRVPARPGVAANPRCRRSSTFEPEPDHARADRHRARRRELLQQAGLIWSHGESRSMTTRLASRWPRPTPPSAGRGWPVVAA